MGSDDLLQFVLQHPTRRFDEPTARWVIETMGPAGDLLELRDRGGHGLVACLLPVGSEGRAVELFVMGYDSPTRPEVGLTSALDWACRRANDRGAIDLEVTVTPGLEALEPILRGRGAAMAFELHMLGVDSFDRCRHLELEPPAGRRWVDLDESNVASAHECYREALAAVSGATVLPLDEFRSLLSVGDWTLRCLVREGRVVAISRVVWFDRDARVGEVRTIARHPRYAEPKLGRLALAEAMRRLRSGGATSVRVEVASDNLLAVGLYRSFGFEQLEISRVYRLPLAAAPRTGARP